MKKVGHCSNSPPPPPSTPHFIKGGGWVGFLKFDYKNGMECFYRKGGFGLKD